MATKVTTLKNAEKTDNLLPRTELNAIFDSDGNYLDSNLKASDLNALKGGTVDELVRFTEDGAGTPIPTDADTLEGHGASYFATADAVTSLRWSLLWTNPNPTSYFSAQTVSVDFSEYDILLVFCKINASASQAPQATIVATFDAGKGAYLGILDDISTNAYRRKMTLASDSSGFTFSGGYLAGNANDSACIPVYVYGIRL